MATRLVKMHHVKSVAFLRDEFIQPARTQRTSERTLGPNNAPSL